MRVKISMSGHQWYIEHIGEVLSWGENAVVLKTDSRIIRVDIRPEQAPNLSIVEMPAHNRPCVPPAPSFIPVPALKSLAEVAVQLHNDKVNRLVGANQIYKLIHALTDLGFDFTVRDDTLTLKKNQNN